MNSKVGWALLVGFGIGAAAGLLLAPQSGEASRRWISKRTRQGVNQASRAVQDAVSQASDAIEKGRDRVASAVDASKKVYTKAAGAFS